jgi:diguanylate cyclase (GGDEF)-like protein
VINVLSLLICDDSPEARELVKASLEGQPEIEVVAEAENGEQAIALAAATRPDVILMDVKMPLLDGIDATRRIRELLPRARIVAYAGSDDTDDVMAMMEAGADAYCVKGAPLWELERALAGASDPLVRLAHGISRSLHGGGITDLVARELVELTGASFAATYLASQEGSLSLAAISGPGAPDSLRSAPGVVARAFSELRLARANTHELGELYRLGAACTDAISAPLVADGEAFGAVLVALPATLQAKADPEVVALVADLVSAALSNERRRALTHAEARRDALTGLANKRAFDERLDAALRNAEESESISLVLFDLDDFKQVNDREGHLVGDDVLREVGRVLMRVVRADDEVFRIGGEEFTVIVDGASGVAARVAERVCGALSEHRRGHELPTASAGVATFPGHASSAEDLLRKADIALYAAKFAGKNRVQVFTDEGEDALAQEVPVQLRALVAPSRLEERGLRLLVVDDDAALRILLRTTFEVVDIEVEEADSAEAAEQKIAARAPDVVVLDVGMPGTDGLTFCRKLKADPSTADIGVVLLTGSDGGTEDAAEECGADAFLRKPFSPLELLNAVERIAGGLFEGPYRTTSGPPEEQLILYAQDLRRLLEVERGQRALIQRAYRETVTALAGALESKDTGTSAHSQRVQRYAIELAGIEPGLLEDESVEYGFLLHDVGKIGIPDKILLKKSSLSSSERRLVETHTVLGEQLLSGVALLQGQGLQIVRHHHERWDGRGYPDGLGEAEIPLGARIFAVADALDAMTSHRPYRRARSWDAAAAEIVGESGRQFDPRVVEAFCERQERLRRIHYELAAI